MDNKHIIFNINLLPKKATLQCHDSWVSSTLRVAITQDNRHGLLTFSFISFSLKDELTMWPEDGLELTILPHLLSAGITGKQEHTKLLEACKFRSVGIAVFSHQGKDEAGQHHLWRPPISSLVPILPWFWNLKCIFNFPQMKSTQRIPSPFLGPRDHIHENKNHLVTENCTGSISKCLELSLSLSTGYFNPAALSVQSQNCLGSGSWSYCFALEGD